MQKHDPHVQVDEVGKTSNCLLEERRYRYRENRKKEKGVRKEWTLDFVEKKKKKKMQKRRKKR